jgi:hypothetical protein
MFFVPPMFFHPLPGLTQFQFSRQIAALRQKVIQMKFKLQPPRVTATADMVTDDGVVLQLTVPHDATQEVILAAMKKEVVKENDRRQATGGVPVATPTLEDMVAAHKLLSALGGDQEIVP